MFGRIYFIYFNPPSPLCIKIFSLSLSVRDRESLSLPCGLKYEIDHGAESFEKSAHEMFAQ